MCVGEVLSDSTGSDHLYQPAFHPQLAVRPCFTLMLISSICKIHWQVNLQLLLAIKHKIIKQNQPYSEKHGFKETKQFYKRKPQLENLVKADS